MATIGQSLTTPESGWKRYNDKNPMIKRVSAYYDYPEPGAYQGSTTDSKVAGDKLKFNFYGTQLRIICFMNYDHGKEHIIKIDGVSKTFSTYRTNYLQQALVFEEIGLEEKVHEIEIVNSLAISFDAIDIDADGRLLHPDEVTDPSELNIGKRIRCHYQAPTSGQVGIFTNLGKETYVDGINDFIPAASSATPNGDFYYICVDKDHLGRWKLIADRNVQHSISWDALNTDGISSGSGLPNNDFYWSNFILDATKASASNESRPVANAFDSNISTVWATGTTSPTVSAPIWMQYDFVKPTIVQGYKITSNGDSPGDWKFQGSNMSGDNATDWTDIYSHVGGSTSIGTLFHEFDNGTAFRYYRFLITKKYGSSGVVVNEIGFFSKVINLEGFSFTTRLLTGGISSTDKDNEWDQYIVNSTLNDSIVAGDNNVWNWKTISSWTSTTGGGTGESGRKVIRGYFTADWVAGYATNSWDTVSKTAFRPVLLIEELGPPPAPPIKGSFFLYEGEYKKLVEGSEATPSIGGIVGGKATPTMTDNYSPSGVVRASVNRTDGYAQFKAFDGLAKTNWSINSSTGWISYQFPEPKLITSYKITGSTEDATASLKVWKLMGSNDSTDGINGAWVDLDARDETFSTTGETKHFSIVNDVKFKEYKINITANNGFVGVLQISEIELIEASTPSIPGIPATPSYWQTISTTPPTAEQFDVEGMKDLSVLDRKQVTHVLPMNEPSLSGEPLGNGKVFKKKVKYKDILNMKVIPK